MIHADPSWSARVARQANAIVANVPPARFPGLQAVMLSAGEVLHAPGRPIRHVYFPLSALVSLFTDTPLQGDVALEVALIGNEGMVGVCLALGEPTAWTSAVVLAPGPALRARAHEFLHALEHTAVLRRRALRYSSELTGGIVQSAACSRNHGTLQRLARWLLMAHARLDGGSLWVTQQAISRALSTRRTGVNAAAVELKRRGLIHYRRGGVEVLDVAGLRAVSCPCLGRPQAR